MERDRKDRRMEFKRIDADGISVVMHDGLDVPFSVVFAEIRIAKKSAEEKGVKLASVQFYPEEKGYTVEYCKEAPHFERIRRITGYLVGTLDRFNDAKRAEEHDRVKHGVESKFTKELFWLHVKDYARAKGKTVNSFAFEQAWDEVKEGFNSLYDIDLDYLEGKYGLFYYEQ